MSKQAFSNSLGGAKLWQKREHRNFSCLQKHLHVYGLSFLFCALSEFTCKWRIKVNKLCRILIVHTSDVCKNWISSNSWVIFSLKFKDKNLLSEGFIEKWPEFFGDVYITTRVHTKLVHVRLDKIGTICIILAFSCQLVIDITLFYSFQILCICNCCNIL